MEVTGSDEYITGIATVKIILQQFHDTHSLQYSFILLIVVYLPIRDVMHLRHSNEDYTARTEKPGLPGRLGPCENTGDASNSHSSKN